MVRTRGGVRRFLPSRFTAIALAIIVALAAAAWLWAGPKSPTLVEVGPGVVAVVNGTPSKLTPLSANAIGVTFALGVSPGGCLGSAGESLVVWPRGTTFSYTDGVPRVVLDGRQYAVGDEILAGGRPEGQVFGELPDDVPAGCDSSDPLVLHEQ